MPTTSLRVGQTTIDLLESEDYSDWSDEELVRGQKKNKLGSWRGRQPKVVPLKLLQELNRRISSWGSHMMTASAKDAIEYITDVVAGRQEPDRDRLHACEIVLNRVWGREPQRLMITEAEESPFEKASRTIVLREVIDVDSEEVENPYEGDPFA